MVTLVQSAFTYHYLYLQEHEQKSSAEKIIKTSATIKINLYKFSGSIDTLFIGAYSITQRRWQSIPTVNGQGRSSAVHGRSRRSMYPALYLYKRYITRRGSNAAATFSGELISCRRVQCLAIGGAHGRTIAVAQVRVPAYKNIATKRHRRTVGSEHYVSQSFQILLHHIIYGYKII